jgi:hypothetical protein
MYIPKSQIKENQFAKSNEWYYVKNNLEYVGFYYLLSNGKAFTGNNINTPPNEEIYRKSSEISSQINSTSISSPPQTVVYVDPDSTDLFRYGRIKKINYNLTRTLPYLSYTIPTSEDYEKGYFKRYFVSKINSLQYIEIIKEVYDYIDTKNKVWVWEDYTPFTLDWYISGDIDKAFKNNRGVINLAEKQLKKINLKKYLKEKYLEYFKYPEADNLTTAGGELITPSGQDYIGSYHIHKMQGPMEGATHISGVHNKLFYKRFYVDNIVNDLNQTGIVTMSETQNMKSNLIQNKPTSGGYSTGGGY